MCLVFYLLMIGSRYIYYRSWFIGRGFSYIVVRLRQRHNGRDTTRCDLYVKRKRAQAISILYSFRLFTRPKGLKQENSLTLRQLEESTIKTLYYTHDLYIGFPFLFILQALLVYWEKYIFLPHKKVQEVLEMTPLWGLILLETTSNLALKVV